MKDQSDWALALGVNRFVYHTFAHKPLGDEHRPGMTMGIYGVHWDRGQTWWPMVRAYHTYISRCSHLMQQGQAVSDILYLTPEGAPMVFTPPADALEENGAIPDKKGYGKGPEKGDDQYFFGDNFIGVHCVRIFEIFWPLIKVKDDKTLFSITQFFKDHLMRDEHYLILY